MPKSPTAPPDPVARMTDVALRKKKNADAQAAFRARRANYIATLEASVTNLESVILEVQDSLRRAEHERDSLRFQMEEHAKYCKMPSSSSPFSDNSHCGTSSHSTPHLHPFSNLHYRDDGHGPPTSSHGPDYTASPFQRSDLAPDATGSSSHLHRAGGKYGAQYPYAMTESSRDMRNGWQMPMLNPALHRGDAVMSGHHPQPPAYMNSPSITSVNDQAEFTGRICVADSKAGHGPTHDGGPCVFPDDDLYHQSLGSGHPSRSASTSSAMHPPAPNPMTSSLAPLTFSDQPQDGGGFTYRHPHSPPLITDGDPLSEQSTDNTRYKISGREINTDHHPMLSSLNEANIQDPNEEDHSDVDNLRIKPHQSTISSRSSSPTRPSISCTVAVIRAQSFGALRRTRASAKKSTEAARITLNVLQSRGIGLRDSDMASKQPFVANDGHHITNTP